jgi:uncharacterized membrane protein
MSDLTPSAPGEPPSPTEGGEFGKPTYRLQMLRMEITESVLVPPEYIRAYTEIDPELARKVVEHNLKVQDQLMQEWLREQAHTRESEKEQAKHDQKQDAQELKAAIEEQQAARLLQRRGQWFATGITAGGFILVAIALLTNNSNAAIWLGCSMVVALAGVFLLGRLLPGTTPSDVAPPSKQPET